MAEGSAHLEVRSWRRNTCTWVYLLFATDLIVNKRRPSFTVPSRTPETQNSRPQSCHRDPWEAVSEDSTWGSPDQPPAAERPSPSWWRRWHRQRPRSPSLPQRGSDSDSATWRRSRGPEIRRSGRGEGTERDRYSFPCTKEMGPVRI